MVLTGGLLVSSHVLPAQDSASPQKGVSSSVSLPVKLDISRRNLKNFLVDEEALSPFRSSDGKIRELTGVFMIGSENTPYTMFWDALSCRLLGVLDITLPPESETAPALPDGDKEESSSKATSPYLLKASGPAQFSDAGGSAATPVYFGFRLVDKKPEFLYRSGPLEVEERLWLEDGGKVMKQRFSAPKATKGFRILIPAAWKERVAVSTGTWKNEVLTVPAESASEVILTYRLTDPEPEPADSN